MGSDLKRHAVDLPPNGYTLSKQVFALRLLKFMPLYFSCFNSVLSCFNNVSSGCHLGVDLNMTKRDYSINAVTCCYLVHLLASLFCHATSIISAMTHDTLDVTLTFLSPANQPVDSLV